jgi:hypothetical protein
MSMFDRLSPELAELGDALQSAVTADLARTQSAAGAGLAVGDARPRSRSRLRAVARSATRTRRRIAVTVAVLVVAVPGAALAANALLSPSQVAGGLAQGTLALLGTHPSCTKVQAGVEYHCVLQSAPSNQGGPAANQWLNTVEPSVGSDKHVNGGCRAQNQAGTDWECYLGQAAVTQKIIGQGFLGAYSPSPGVG